MAKIRYALPAWGGFVKATEIGRINSLLRKCKKFGYCKMVYTFEDLLMDSDKKLFKQLQHEKHCLHQLLPERRSLGDKLRVRNHSFLLPSCKTELHKSSFINRALFLPLQ